MGEGDLNRLALFCKSDRVDRDRAAALIESMHACNREDPPISKQHLCGSCVGIVCQSSWYLKHPKSHKRWVCEMNRYDQRRFRQ